MGPPSFPPSPGRETLDGGAEGELGRGSLQVLFPEVGPAAVGVYGSNRPMGKKSLLHFILFYYCMLGNIELFIYQPNCKGILK